MKYEDYAAELRRIAADPNLSPAMKDLMAESCTLAFRQAQGGVDPILEILGDLLGGMKPGRRTAAPPPPRPQQAPPPPPPPPEEWPCRRADWRPPAMPSVFPTTHHPAWQVDVSARINFRELSEIPRSHRGGKKKRR